MRVCLFEDPGARDLEPLTLTRPAFDLLCGLSSLAAKQYQAFAADSRAALVRPHLADVCRQGPGPTPAFCAGPPADPVGVAFNDPDWLRAGPAVLVNGR
jgi:hypothetical protein